MICAPGLGSGPHSAYRDLAHEGDVIADYAGLTSSRLARSDSILQTISGQRECRSRVRDVALRASLALLLKYWIHIPVLKNLFQIRPYAQVGDVIGDGRKSMRHAFRDDDNVARLYLTARVSHHRAAAGRAVQNCCHFASGADRLPLTRVPPVIRVALPDMTT